jgi:hypothetical protein
MASAKAVIAEQPQGERKPGSLLGTVAMTLVLVYLAGFALVLIDQLFFDGRIWNLMPDAMETQAKAGLQTVYAPLIWLFKLILL